jgi:uroporphyrin-III C-methyltransferase
VRHGADAAAIVQRHDVVLARQLFALDLRDAEAALLARDAERWRAALADAGAILAGDFAADAEAVRAARKHLDALSAAVLAPPPPENLGAALRELRNLRATHALRQPAPAAPATAPQEPSGERH